MNVYQSIFLLLYSRLFIRFKIFNLLYKGYVNMICTLNICTLNHIHCVCIWLRYILSYMSRVARVLFQTFSNCGWDLGISYCKKSLQRHLKKTKTVGAFSFLLHWSVQCYQSIATQCTNLKLSLDAEDSYCISGKIVKLTEQEYSMNKINSYTVWG